MTYQLNDYSISTNGTPFQFQIADWSALEKRLQKYRAEEPKFIDLIAPNGDVMALGIGGEWGHAMYMDSSGNPPYLSTRWDESESGDFIEFDVGGTLTPILQFKCVPYDILLQIAKWFVQNGTLYPDVNWGED